MKTILVVGATGAGKSTLINAFTNYLLGVQFDDKYRFRIVDEDLQANQSRSQTKWVTAYVLYYQVTFPQELPYSLTIIDTPGFGDTEGIQADKKITEQLSEYFHAKGHEGIDTLDAIGFVVQASSSRLTAHQRYIFDSILALFGKDVKDNIFALVTFADGQKPPVIVALNEAKLPYTQAFKFNNSALFADTGRAFKSQSLDDDDSDTEMSFDQNYWAMGASSYRKFLVHLSRTEPISLVLTNEVLDARQRIETRVTGVQQQIRFCLEQMENLRSFFNCLLTHRKQIERNKDYIVPVKTSKIVAMALPRGLYVTNCLTCNMTCHYPCTRSNDTDKYKCAAMTKGMRYDATCRVCPQECHWSIHRNSPERLVVHTVTEHQTVSQMKKEYEEACKQQLTTEELIMKVMENIQGEEIKTTCLVDEVRSSLQKLSEIALRPNHMTTVDYIDVLIQSERNQCEPGWKERVDQLYSLRTNAETIKNIAEYDGVNEPWEDIRQTMASFEKGKGKGNWFQTLSEEVSGRWKQFTNYLPGHGYNTHK